MKQFRIGCIGLGMIARAVHLPQIAESPGLRLTALCDINTEWTKDAGEQYGIDPSHRFSDYRELIACQDVDAVVICTPNDSHFEITMAAVRAGKPYALEKPVAMNSRQAGLLADETAKAGLKSMVCFSYRFKAAARYARELIAQGALGDLYHVNMQYFQDWGLQENGCPLVWRFVKSQSGSGALGDLGSHALDLVRFVTGREYERLVACADTFVRERPLPVDANRMGRCDVDDFCNMLAQMEDGLFASFQITRFGYGRGNYQRMEVYGSRGSLVYKLDEKPDEDELMICLGRPMGETHTFTALSIPARYRAAQMQAFADILGGSRDGLAATIEDGRINQRLLDAAIESFEYGKWVDLYKEKEKE